MDRTNTKIFERAMWVLEDHRIPLRNEEGGYDLNVDGGADNSDYINRDENDVYHEEWRDEYYYPTDPWYIPKDDWSGGTMKVPIGEDNRSLEMNGWRQLIHRHRLEDLYKDIL